MAAASHEQNLATRYKGMYCHRPYRSTTVSSNKTHVLRNVSQTAKRIIPGVLGDSRDGMTAGYDFKST